MVFKTTKDMLLAEGNTYTMVKGGKQRVTKANGTGNNPFEVLRDVFTNDMKSAEIRTLCIHERADNYTQYDFSNYVLNKEISNSMFNPQIVKKQ